MSPAPIDMSPDRVRAMKYCYLTLRWSTRQIGVAFEISPQSAGRALRKAGVQLRPRGKPNSGIARPMGRGHAYATVDHDAIIQAYSHGRTIRQIGHMLGASESAIRYHLDLAGVLRPTYRRRDCGDQEATA